MTTAISGTIVAVQHSDDRTVLQVASGGNGSKRQDSVVLPGRRDSLTSGKAVRLVNFVRSEDGSLIPGESAKISIAKLESVAPITDAVVAAPEQPAQEQVKTSLPAPPAKPVPLKPAPVRQHTGGLMVFSDKSTRKAVFNRAVDVAREFAEHIRKSGQMIKIQGRDYVTVAGWSLLPAFESANCYTVSQQIQPDGTVIAEAIVEKDGAMVSRGFGACSEKERPKINDRLAMAQTRARGSSLKARYSVLVTLAGYDAALADEVEDAAPAKHIVPVKAVTAVAQPKPTKQQVDYALSMFDGDITAVIEKAAALGVNAQKVDEVPLPILKRIVEQQVNERKRLRAEAAAVA